MPISQKSEGDLDPLIYIPLGGLVRPKSAAFPQRITLNGRYVALRPLQASHIRPLYSSIGGSNNAHLWRYMLSGPYFSLQDFEDAMHKEMQRTDALFWTIFGPPKSQDPDEVQYTLPIGQIALHRIDPSNRVIEVGYVLYSSSLQRTPAATECIYLLARYVFNELGYRRFEWKCNDHNTGSKKAARRLGFSHEGTFLNHMVIKGRSRDTSWWAMTDGEWEPHSPDTELSSTSATDPQTAMPEQKDGRQYHIRAGFEMWLSPQTFDINGEQYATLEESRKTAEMEYRRSKAAGASVHAEQKRKIDG